jgi:hypothetical protein
MFSPKFAWNDYFTGSPETTLNSSQYSSRQTPSVSSVYVFNCLFNKCTISSGSGGALSCTSATYFFVESSFFFSCKTNSGMGGAIYFSTSNCLQSVLYGLCGYDCSSTSIGPFAGIFIKDSTTTKNHFNYSSMVCCLSDASGSCEMSCIQYGKVYCPSLNSSMNRCPCFSGIFFYPTTDLSSVTSSLSYSTIAYNNATDYNCIYCYLGKKYEIKHCNILRNRQVSNKQGIIYSSGDMIIEDSCILENIGSCIFYQADSSYTITLSNCTVDLTTNNGYLTTQKTVSKSFIHGLHHMSTQNCHSEYDSAGTLTAIPYISPSTKKAFRCTCHYQARISDFISLIWVFVITFIHPNPSEDF